MRTAVTNCLVLSMLTTGLVIGPAAHRIQHGSELAKTAVRPVAASPSGVERATWSPGSDTKAFEPTTCVLCQIVDGQIVLEAVQSHPDDDPRIAASAGPSVQSALAIDLERGRAPPATA